MLHCWRSINALLEVADTQQVPKFLMQEVRLHSFVIGVAFRILSHFGCAMLGLIVIIKGFCAFRRSIRLAQTADPWYPSMISATADSLSDSLNSLQAERTLNIGEARHRRHIMLARFPLDAHAHIAAHRS